VQVGVAVIGYGSIARAHVRALAVLNEAPRPHHVRLRAVVGRLAEPAADFAREFGFARATTHLDEALADPTVEAVLVCSPTDLHAQQTKQALKSGKHVLCEIPLATSLAETDRLIGLADEVGRTLMICHTERYYPALVEARRMVQAGELLPHAVVSRYMFHRRENVNWVGRRRSWTDNLLWHHGCHAVDAALWLLGATEVETAAQVALPSGNLNIPMDLSILMRTPRDQIATVAMSYNTHMPFHDYLVIGEEMTVLFSDGQLRDKDRVLVSGTPTTALDEAIVRQDAEFFDAIEEGREPAISGRAVRPVMSVLQAAQDTLDARLRSLGPSARHSRPTSG
jgi:2-hydroxy-4-carboxymuconate semialdehyde hemiacetal dehydrogenase